MTFRLAQPVDSDAPHVLLVEPSAPWTSPSGNACLRWLWMDGTRTRSTLLAFRCVESALVAPDAEATSLRGETT